MDIFGIKKTQVKAEATIDNINNLTKNANDLVNESRAALKRTEDLANTTVNEARQRVDATINEARQRIDQAQSEIRAKTETYEKEAKKTAKIVTTCEIVKTVACVIGTIGIGWLCIKK